MNVITYSYILLQILSYLEQISLADVYFQFFLPALPQFGRHWKPFSFCIQIGFFIPFILLAFGVCQSTNFTGTCVLSLSVISYYSYFFAVDIFGKNPAYGMDSVVADVIQFFMLRSWMHCMYTVGHKNVASNFCKYLCQILTNFKKNSTVALQ